MTARFGIIGAGRMGSEHMRRLAAIDETEIAAIADVNLQLANARAGQYGAAAYADAREMVAREELDAVVIATPGRWHREHVELAAQAGLAILLEKPVALTMEDALAIDEAVSDADLVTAVGYQWRNLSFIDEARRRLADQPVSMVNGIWYWTTPLVSWIANRHEGGGQIVAQATHLLDLARYLVGEIRLVYGRYTVQARAGQPGFDNWDACALAFEFESGAVGALQATYALFADCPVPVTLDVICRDLLVRITSRQMEVHQPGQSLTKRADGQWGLNLDRSFARAVLTGDRGDIRCDVREAVRSLAVSLAANESARSGRPIDVSELLGR